MVIINEWFKNIISTKKVCPIRWEVTQKDSQTDILKNTMIQISGTEEDFHLCKIRDKEEPKKLK